MESVENWQKANKKIRDIFNLAETIGETTEGNVHIYKVNKRYGRITYRVYIENMYCFEVLKEYACPPGEKVDEYHYSDGCRYFFLRIWQGEPVLTFNYAFMLLASAQFDKSKEENGQ
jgi:hypothetical protein